MSDNMNFGEKNIDEFMKNINIDDITVSKQLDERISKRIEKLKPKKHYIRNAIVACILILTVFISGINFSPTFASYASNIPGLKKAVNFLKWDKGLQNAYENGYENVPEIIIDENDYILKLKDIFIDGGRISLSAELHGEKIKEIEKEATENISIVEYPSLHIGLKFKDINYVYTSSSSKELNDFFSESMEYDLFNSHELRKLLNKNIDYLETKAIVYKNDDVLYEFKNIKIPIDNIKLSKSIKLNQKYSFKYGNLDIIKLDLNPTKMSIYMKIDGDMEDDNYRYSFDDIYLKDDKGKIYESNGMYRDTDYFTYDFLPSIYYNKMPKKLYLCIDGLIVSTKWDKTYKLYLNDTYPKTIKYGNKDIIIKNVEYNKDESGYGTLKITHTLPKESSLRGIPGIYVKDTRFKSTETLINENGKDIMYFLSTSYTDKKDFYEVIIDSAIDKIDIKEEIELKLK